MKLEQWHIWALVGVVIAIIIGLVFNKNKNIEGLEDKQSVIPLHIYQTWHTKKLPPKMKECVEKLKKDNPEFEHHLYDIEDCRKFIGENFDKEVLDAYDKLKPLAFKADLWRYCVLYKNGGIYLDVKYKCENNFKLIDVVNSELLVKEFWDGKFLENVIYNGVIICKPNNNVLDKIIKRICWNVQNKYYSDKCSGQTGPSLLGTFYSKEEINNINYVYYEKNKRGFVKHIPTNKIILSFYPEYRDDQKSSKKEYWQDMWKNKNVYL
jgi:mannosyltransferase OCH1-like enzyme